VQALQRLYDDVLTARARRPSLAARLLGRRRRDPVTGLYLWGGVGRGKTYLVDTFFEALPFEEKRRLHFHRFMQLAHRDLNELRDRRDPLEIVADRFAARAQVLCFDEFFVSDIADAMVLGGLLQALFERGVTLVATSNIPPERLYHDGLQRERFLPAIAALERHTQILNVDSGIDYRLRYLERAETYHVSHNGQAQRPLDEAFRQVTSGVAHTNTEIEIEGRPIPVRRLTDGVAWFDFDALCDGPRGHADYIELARQFHTVLIGGVPVFSREHDDQARRFIALVDEFYDRQVTLILTAAAAPEALYRGRRLAFAFERTVSRLQEMQSREYLARPHRP